MEEYYTYDTKFMESDEIEAIKLLNKRKRERELKEAEENGIILWNRNNPVTNISEEKIENDRKADLEKIQKSIDDFRDKEKLAEIKKIEILEDISLLKDEYNLMKLELDKIKNNINRKESEIRLNSKNLINMCPLSSMDFRYRKEYVDKIYHICVICSNHDQEHKDNRPEKFKINSNGKYTCII